MMKLEKALKERRSIRKFNGKKLSKNLLGSILDAARYAPSAGNLQNWRFLVVEEEDKKEKIAKACLSQKWMTKSGAVVAVLSDDSDVKRMYGNKSDFYGRQNCAAAIQNMLLKAHSINISSCWVGAFNEKELRKILRIPDELNFEAVLCFGHSDEKPKMPHRTDLRNLVHFEEWGKMEK